LKPEAIKWILCISSFILISIFHLSFPQDSSAQREAFIGRKSYVLYGSAELAYERRWLREGDDALSTFTQNYNLGLRGSLIDPRLINFDVSGILTDSSRNTGEDDYTLKGVNLNLNLLERIPPKLRGAWRFIPNPISLRYSHYSNDYESTNYGVSLAYSLEKLRPVKKENGKNGAPIPLPTLLFDYDRYDYGQGNYNIVTDTYSLRSSITGKHYDYRFLYENWEQKGATEYKRSALELQPNYRFYNKETKRSLNVTNLLRMTETNDIKNLDLRSNVSWLKPIGKDSLSFSGGAGYSSALNGEKTESYDASVSGAYTKAFSPRLTDTVSLSMGVGQSNDRNTHSERLSNAIGWDISRLFRGSGSVFLGNTQDGRDFGFGASLSTKTRITITTDYSFESIHPENGETLRHTFNLGASGPIRRNLTFNTALRYKIEDVSSPVDPYSENSLYGTANLSWQLRKTSLSLGGNYTLTEKENGQTVETKNTSIYGSLSRLLTRRTFLNVYSSWTMDSDGKETLEIKPRLSWARGLTSVAIEYDYRSVKEPAGAASGEQRIFVRAVRRFGGRF